MKCWENVIKCLTWCEIEHEFDVLADSSDAINVTKGDDLKDSEHEDHKC
jgi:hypothetical protein